MTNQRGSSRPLAAGFGVLMLLVGALGAFVLRGYLDDGGEEFTQGPGEVFLEPADTQGPDPFSPTPLAPPPLPVHIAADPGAEPDTSGLKSDTGTTPGLYGGSNDYTVCDAEAIATFLEQNPEKAEAFVLGINADPDVYFRDGPLTVDNLSAYIATLSPIVLRDDVRVTNNGFKNGKPTPRQSVLQKGTAALVDQKGVPRIKCYCGNPLSPPRPTETTVTYAGGNDDWQPPVDPHVYVPDEEPKEGGLEVALHDCAGPDCETVTLPDPALCPFDDPRECFEWMSSGGDADQPTPTTTPPDEADSSETTEAPTTTEETTTTEAPSTTVAPILEEVPPTSTECTEDTGETPAVSATFVNNSDQPLQVYWHGYDCAPQFMDFVGVGETLGQSTFETHVFSWVDLTGNIVSTFEISGGTDSYSAE